MSTPWSTIVSSLPESATPEREALLLVQVLAGNVVHRWATIAAGRIELDVSEDALRVGTPGDAVRIAVNASTAQLIADHFDAMLLTPRMADLIRQQAAVVIAPANQAPDAAMANTSRMVAHSRTVDQRIAGRTGLVSNAGKDWCLTNRLAAQPDRSANYGWHVGQSNYPGTLPGLCVLQPLGLAHNRFHVDYSQTVRMVRARCRVDGVERALVDVLSDSTLAPLICHEGVLRVFRQPGVARVERSVGVGEGVAVAGAAIAVGTRELAAMLTTPPAAPGGHALTPPSPSNQGGHPLPPTKDSTMPTAPRSTIRVGSKGPDVVRWQTIIGVAQDGAFGPGTEAATKKWQAARGLVADGVVGPATWRLVAEVPAVAQPAAPKPPAPTADGVTFIQSRNYRIANRPASAVRVIVLHTMEAAEKPYTAENVAKWFAGHSAPMASAHYCIDNDSTVQCVKLSDVAFAAPGANNDGIQIEMAARAAQSPADWADEYSTAMLDRVTDVLARLSADFNIPLEYVGAAGLLAGARGVTTHLDVSKAYKKSDHADPGPHFPMAAVLASAMAKRAAL